MDFKQLALAARTCRRFEEERPLQMADLEWLVDCARLTPAPVTPSNCVTASWVPARPAGVCSA